MLEYCKFSGFKHATLCIQSPIGVSYILSYAFKIIMKYFSIVKHSATKTNSYTIRINENVKKLISKY